MATAPRSRYERFLQWAAARKLTIPPETRVDPSPFTEDEFPVYCPKCGYLLRGLPDGRCPECGREFDHGRLLVEQYVREPGKHSHPMTARWAVRTYLAGSVLLACGGILLGLIGWLEQQVTGFGSIGGSGGWPRACGFTLVVASLVGLLLLMVSAGLGVRLAVISRRKRKRVLDAIDHSHPDFVVAQRTLWLLPAMIFGIGAAFATSYLLSLALGEPGGVTPPLHLILPMVVGCGTTLVIILVSGCVHRPKKP